MCVCVCAPGVDACDAAAAVAVVSGGTSNDIPLFYFHLGIFFGARERIRSLLSFWRVFVLPLRALEQLNYTMEAAQKPLDVLALSLHRISVPDQDGYYERSCVFAPLPLETDKFTSSYLWFAIIKLPVER